MRVLLSFLLFIFINISVFGTKQMPDKIIYNANMYNLLFNPMESFFKNNPEKNPLRHKETRWATGLYRGYVATFEVKDSILYLKDIEINLSSTIDERGYATSNWKSIRDQLFPDQESIMVDWEIELLVFPIGKEIHYPSWISGYKQYILLEIENGKVLKEKVFNYSEYEKFKRKQLQTFKKTDDYKSIKELGWSNKYLKYNIARFTSKILFEN